MGSSANTLTAARPDVAARSLAIPGFLYAVLFGSTSIIVGLQWDISWHMSIGRDTFWSPPHLAIYLGGVVAGLASGWQVLRSTFSRRPAAAEESVRIWSFKGPLGAFVCIWGAFAMLTSAPFDDWWHNTYGLDTKILSPPHMVLAAGIIAIQIGAMLAALALQNRSEDQSSTDDPRAAARRTRLRALYVYAAGILLASVSVSVLEYTLRVFMHSSIFYQVVCGAFPLFMIAAARASRRRWPATATAAVYTGLILLMHWVLPLFPAEPKLGPVRQQVTHMVPLAFPLLILFPAVAIDLLLRRLGGGRDGRLALWLGVAFFAALLAVQWPFGDFLLSPYSRNWIFATHRLAYYIPPHWYMARHEFYPWDITQAAFLRGMAWAVPLAMLSAWLGLWWGNWMRKVQR